MVPQILNEGGGEKVTVLALDEAGRVSAFTKAFQSVIKATSSQKMYI